MENEIKEAPLMLITHEGDASQQEKFRNDYVESILKEAWREYCNAEYDKSKIPEIREIEKKNAARAEEIRGQLNQIENDHSKQAREQRKELRSELKVVEQTVRDCAATIMTILRTSKQSIQKGDMFQKRAAFIKSFDYSKMQRDMFILEEEMKKEQEASINAIKENRSTVENAPAPEATPEATGEATAAPEAPETAPSSSEAAEGQGEAPSAPEADPNA